MNLDFLALGLRFGLGTLFAVSSFGKLLSHRKFIMTTLSYELLPDRLAIAVGWFLPLLELAAAIVLFLGVGLRPAAVAMGAMLLVLTFAILINLIRKREIECGCFGELWTERIGPSTVARNMLLLSALGTLFILNRPYLALGQQGASARQSLPDLLPVLLASYSLLLLFVLVLNLVLNRQAMAETKPDLTGLAAKFAAREGQA